MKRAGIPLVLFVVLAVFLAIGLQRDPRLVPSPLIGKPAPAFTLPSLHNAQQTLRNADLAGQAYVLSVWASWCAACVDEHPLLMAFARQGLAPVYGLNYKDERPRALAWLRTHGDPYAASLFDDTGRFGIDLGVYGVPETFVVDRQGRIRFKHVGVLTPQVLSDHIEPLLRSLQQEGT